MVGYELMSMSQRDLTPEAAAFLLRDPVGWEKFKIKATAKLARMKSDPDITLLFSRISYILDLGLKMLGRKSIWSILSCNIVKA